MNNSICSLDKTSNEIVYEFISIQSSSLITSFIAIQNNISSMIRKEIFDVIVWSQLRMKKIYDRKHQSLFMKFEDYALLKLHKKYNILVTKILRKKLSQQYAEFFKILQKMRNLAYRLQLSNHWRIHSIIFIAQLESISDSIKNSYFRSRSKESDFVQMKDDTENIKSFEIKRLIDKRIITRDIEYLIRWKSYASQHDEWRSVSELENAKNLIQNYETFMNNVIILSDRLSRNIQFTLNSFTIVTNNSLNNSFKSKDSLETHTTSIRRSDRKRKSRERD
jgi:hypothetical protein